MRVFLLFALVCVSVHHAQGLTASNNNSVLILGSSTIGGASSMERNRAVALGYTVDIATNAQWLAMTAADFASYRALFLGDPNCVVGEAPIMAAITNVAVWAPVVTGNVVIQGTDPVFHNKPRTISAFQSFAASSAPGTTGLWLCLSCYYNDAVNLTRPWMNALKGPSGGPDFYMYGAGAIQNGCSLPAHIVAVSPALGDLTDADITGWSCSTHEGFSMWPTDYTPLAITQTPDGSGSFHAADGTTGYPYTLARGAVTLIGCQPNEIFTNGQCVPCGDGASSTGGACVCNNGNPYPDCGCGSGCASKTIAVTCEATTVFSSSNCASLTFDASSPCI